MENRKQIITVASSKLNSYGHLEFTSTEKPDDKPFKIPKNRVAHFESIQVGAEVILEWAVNSHDTKNEYIYSASQTGTHYPPDQLPKAPEHKSTPQKTESKATIPSGQEQGMWWKELGEMIRAGDVDTKTPFGKALRLAYYAKMFIVLDLNPPKE